MTKNIFAAVAAAGLLASCAVMPAFAADKCISPAFVQHAEETANQAGLIKSWFGAEANNVWMIAQGFLTNPKKSINPSEVDLFFYPDQTFRVVEFTQAGCVADMIDNLSQPQMKAILAALHKSEPGA